MRGTWTRVVVPRKIRHILMAQFARSYESGTHHA
ncbi:hypothetical protein EV561_115126 [Rhizobium sp. BK376]|nr:hypothetical protein EV561_115126 [Rhizobium sp. BK376]